MASYLDATGEGHALDLLSIQATSTSWTQDLLTRILHQPDQPRRHTRAAIPRTARPRKRDSPVQPGRPPLRNRPDQRTCQRDAGPARCATPRRPAQSQGSPAGRARLAGPPKPIPGIRKYATGPWSGACMRAAAAASPPPSGHDTRQKTASNPTPPSAPVPPQAFPGPGSGIP